MSAEMPYNPGQGALPNRLLARFLPPIPSGVVSGWLEAHCQPHALVIDPFGASPQLAVEAARAGYRVIVAANNPVSRFLIELEADPPSLADLQHVIADLAASRRGDERLEPHLRALYRSECPQCGSEVEAQAFIWDREKGLPIQKTIHCRACGAHGEFPTSDEDIALAQQYAQSKLHRARALERVAGLNDSNRTHVEEALEVYLPRAIYALFHLINKLDALENTQRAHRDLAALILCVCDRANNLWSYPSIRARPKQLTTPPKYREHNVWLALEQATEQIISDSLPVPLVSWPELPPPEGGISLFEGRLKDLSPELARISSRAVICALPRQNQAFWTLSALWAGWLWGREAIGPFSVVLRRKRYDWNWHATALHAAWETLSPVLPADTPCCGLIGEAEPGYLSAAMLSAALAGMQLAGYALRAEDGQAQLLWQIARTARAGAENQPSFASLVSEVAQAGQQHLQVRGEPCEYLSLHTLGLVSLIDNMRGNSQTPAEGNLLVAPSEAVTTANNIFAEAFTYRQGYLRLAGSEKSLEVGLWWLRSPLPGQLRAPLADRVEKMVVEHLLRNPLTSTPALEKALGDSFPGALMPSPQIVQECLRSYGELTGPDSWRLREEDQPQARRTNLREIAAILTSLGKRFGWQVSGDQPLAWLNPDGSLAYAFFLVASAILGEILADPSHDPARSLIVLPGGRASLVLFKQKHNPLLAQAASRGWRFLKFRHVYQLSEQPMPSQESLEEQFKLDPLTEDNLQMRLL